ncbi:MULTISPECIES: glucose 1-dehydrogenase [unclassified Minwuia]|jgi:A-factor type gamma-butyrolactone 1'-reductase (1S-forming)|uniref:glucose 1-dehydrogenase n=1 Tax=unclassified Minwuia TaxID=2618799 RepID=UPI002479DEB0|nr:MULTISPECIES: glucose 1-dehydrogenase [unclassified Minwuia]MDF1730382.1 glucose 1-dehydrogenase [Minwuia sp.]
MLQGKRILITGAGGGIGQAAAVLAAAEGAKVMIADVNQAGLEETLETMKAAGGDGQMRVTDVTSEKDVEGLVADTIAAFGGLDGAYNNAGIEGDWAKTAESSLDNFNRVVSVNQTGVFLCMRAEIQAMLKAGTPGSIVNTASIAGIAGAQYMPAYVASKHGVVGLTASAAMEYARKGIRINCVCPGPIETRMLNSLASNHPRAGDALSASTAMKRLGQPVEIAQAACWLMSDRASYITGVALPVDGGMIAGP